MRRLLDRWRATATRRLHRALSAYTARHRQAPPVGRPDSEVDPHRRDQLRPGRHRHRGNATRQGRDVGQAWLHHRGTAHGTAAYGCRDRPHLVGELLRTVRGPRRHPCDRAGECGRDRPCGADRRSRTASAEPAPAARLVLPARQVRRRAMRHREPSGRAVPHLHRVNRRRDRYFDGRKLRQSGRPGSGGFR